MKQSILILVMATSLFACKKSEDPKPEEYKCTTCIQSPEAKEAYNQSSAGVYKGVIVGSSGTIALYLYNIGAQVQALVTFDGKSGTLSTTSLSNWNPGDAINNALFSGIIDGQSIQIYFSVNANGQNPTVTMVIPGHNVSVAVYKETSTSLIKNFEGTYSGDQSGIFNITFNGNNYILVTDSGEFIEGTLINGGIDLNHEETNIKGHFEGNDEIKGTWEGSENESGTWTGRRTL